MGVLADLAKSLREFTPNLLEEARHAEMQTAAEARRIAITDYSQGGYSLGNLADAGHPFGFHKGKQRGSSDQYPPDVINSGMDAWEGDDSSRGMFAISWAEPAQDTSGGATSTTVLNTDPDTAFLFGTPTMVDRSGMLEEIEADVEERREQLHDAAIDRAFDRF